MMTTIVIVMTLVTATLLAPLSPVKMSFMLVAYSMILFYQLMSASSSVWMSSIFFMIFIGGIMVMFMILSSLLPNEKNMKLSKISLAIFSLFFFFVSVFLSENQMESSFNQGTKAVFLSNQSFQTLIMVVLLYFLSFVYIISKQSFSLRSFSC